MSKHDEGGYQDQAHERGRQAEQSGGGSDVPGRATVTSRLVGSRDPHTAVINLLRVARGQLVAVRDTYVPAAQAAIDAEQIHDARSAISSLQSALSTVDRSLEDADVLATAIGSESLVEEVSALEMQRTALFATVAALNGLAPPPGPRGERAQRAYEDAALRGTALPSDLVDAEATAMASWRDKLAAARSLELAIAAAREEVAPLVAMMKSKATTRSRDTCSRDDDDQAGSLEPTQPQGDDHQATSLPGGSVGQAAADKLALLESTTQELLSKAPALMANAAGGKSEWARILQADIERGRGSVNELTTLQQGGALAEAKLEDRYLIAKTRFENLEAQILPVTSRLQAKDGNLPAQADEPPTTVSHAPWRCDDSVELRCYLTPQERARTNEKLAHRVLVALQSFHAAVGKKRVENLVTPQTGWGFLPEVLFSVLNYAIGAGLVKGILALKAAVSMRPRLQIDPGSITGYEDQPAGGRFDMLKKENIVGAWSHMARGLRITLRSNVSSLPPEVQFKDRFLVALLAEAHVTAQAVSEGSVEVLADAELEALTEAYDAGNHTPTMYEQLVDDLMNRFGEQEIDKIGEVRMMDGARQVSLLRSKGRVRRAMVLQWHGSGNGRVPETQPLFLHWIDDDIAGYADAVQRDRMGDVKIIDLDELEGPMMAASRNKNEVPRPSVEVAAWLSGAKEWGGK